MKIIASANGTCALAGLLFAAILSAAPSAAPARTWHYEDSPGVWKSVDDPGPDPRATPLPERLAGGNLTYTIIYEDAPGAGFNDPAVGPARKAVLVGVLQYVDVVLAHTSAVEVRVRASGPINASAIVSGGTYFPGSPSGLEGGLAYDHITTGADPAPTLSDILLKVDFSNNIHAGFGQPAANQYDLYTLLLGAVVNGLGFITASDANGGSIPGSLSGFNVFSKLDGFLRTGNGVDLWTNGGTFQGTSAMLAGLDGGVVFSGANAIAAHGSMPRIHAPNPFVGAVSLSHWQANLILPFRSSLEWDSSPGVVARKLAPVDLAMLKDLGWAVCPQPPLQANAAEAWSDYD